MFIFCVFFLAKLKIVLLGPPILIRPFLFNVFRIIFAPAGLAKEFNMDKSSIFIIRFA